MLRKGTLPPSSSEVKNMRAHWVGVFLIAFATLGNAQADRSRYSVTGAIKSSRYCDPDDRLRIMLLRFDARLANSFDKSVSLTVSPPVFPVVYVARSLENLFRKKYEFELSPPDVFAADSPAPATRTQLVRAGEAIDLTTAEITFPIARTGDFDRFAELAPGVHYVELLIQVTEGKGTIRQVISEPIKIEVPENPSIGNCLQHHDLLGNDAK